MRLFPQSPADIKRAVLNHIRDRVPRDFPGRIIVILGECHNTIGAVAHSMPALDCFRGLPSKRMLVERTAEAAEYCDFEAARNALTIHAALQDGPLPARFSQDDFRAVAAGGRANARELGKLIETYAKLDGYEMGGFDPLYDDYMDSDAREAAMIDAIRREASDEITIVKAGGMHVDPLHKALSEDENTVVVSIVQLTDPNPQSRAAVERCRDLLANPDILVIRDNTALDNQPIDMSTAIAFARRQREVTRALINQLNAFAHAHPEWSTQTYATGAPDVADRA